ncbi:MAG: SDR family oxidoreductase [Chloroflexi bacterium]|nr:SDR family oxidoreductase [Chloroflexota bacterium]MBI3338575.1 SDR family oxidoreductase [Chloroflexota bacterium]
MRLLITGASGLLGLNLALDAGQSHDVTGVDRSTLKTVPFKVIKADLLDPQAVGRVLESKPEAVIHCAALANVDACESDPELARRMNAELPYELADACLRRKIRLVHISTDAVFDGQMESYYTESDRPNPLGVYAQTKYAGEQAVLQVNPLAIVARVNFYGWSLSGRRSLAEFFVNNLSAGKTVNGFTDVIFCPMLVNHLGGVLLEMIEKGLHGLYHVVGPEAMSKYQFGVEIARKFGLKESLISPQSVDKSSLTARRSHNLWLSIHKLSTDLGHPLPIFSTGLQEFYTQYQRGYPQKIRSYQQP